MLISFDLCQIYAKTAKLAENCDNVLDMWFKLGIGGTKWHLPIQGATPLIYPSWWQETIKKLKERDRGAEIGHFQDILNTYTDLGAYWGIPNDS